jgi:hypothetical protein
MFPIALAAMVHSGWGMQRLGHVADSRQIDDEKYAKRDDGGCKSEKQHVSNIMASYALPLWDIGHRRGRLSRHCFGMITRFRVVELHGPALR